MANTPRPSARDRGYDREHFALRARWQRKLNAGEVITCWRCGNRIDPKAWHLGHDDFDRTKYRGPECVPCNVNAPKTIRPSRRKPESHPGLT